MRTEYDIIVVGGGHAGCEAACAAARMGSTVLLITMDMGKFAQMSCNPAVGGVAKGQIVREIDALGGRMGIIADRSTIQFRMLNRSKGPAMWSPRAQCDKELFSELWKKTLQNTTNLWIWQDTVSEILHENDENPSFLNGVENRADAPSFGKGPNKEDLAGQKKGAAQTEKAYNPEFGVARPVWQTYSDSISATSRPRACGVRTRLGVEFRARAVILTAGTFLNGLMHVGRSNASGGRHGDAASFGLTECLRALGFESGRMKTGTPARLDARSINFEVLETQYGDEKPSKFSFLPEIEPVKHQEPCFIVNTSAEIHKILRSGFADSPLFNGTIQGVGPRYCPSIEDKLRTFADKDSHQLFLEPEGKNTNEYYLNGFSSSLPWQIQFRALSKIRGFENLQLYRPGYAIEYDYFPPNQLYHTLETKPVRNLWFAGQINGTTGYEEAAAQGLMAGINTHRSLNGQSPVVLQRDEAYIGVLIDDLVTKGVDEPYRMFTSRAEYRILLRQDNADLRLTELGYSIGLAEENRYRTMKKKQGQIAVLEKFLRDQKITPEEIHAYFDRLGVAQFTQSRRLHDAVLRSGVTIRELAEQVPALKNHIETLGIPEEVVEEAEIQIKYKGYIEREKHMADKMHRLENIPIPADFDLKGLQSLSTEARQKLTRIRPTSLGQASRIPGVSPADINVLLVFFGR